jgi:hypothetical protein
MGQAASNVHTMTTLAGRSRAIAASVLLVGSLLAIVGSFLPLGQATYPALDGDPATTIVEIPGQTIIKVIEVNL